MAIVRPFGPNKWQVLDDGRPHVNVAGPVVELTHVTCQDPFANSVPPDIAIAHPNVELVGAINGVWLCRDCGFVFTINGAVEA